MVHAEYTEQSASRGRRASGFTIVELMVVVAIIVAIVAVAVPMLVGQASNQRAKDTARQIAGLLDRARAEAIRTGEIHIVYVGTDATGATLTDTSGNPAAALILNDGVPGESDQNCLIDSGEPTWTLADVDGVGLGTATSTGKAPNDEGAGAVSSGSTFTEPPNTPAQWVLFRPDGMPLSFNDTCTMGAAGSGGGGFYLTNGTRSYAVVLRPMGGAKVHAYDDAQGVWTQ